MTSPPLEVRGLVRAVGRRGHPVLALDGVDLTVRAGAVHGLLGPNGAGKTTLLRTVLGLLRPTVGTVRALGADPAAGTPAGLAGFVDAPRFYPQLSGLANLRLLAAYDRSPIPPAQVLERVGLSARAQERVGGWSTGMRQRLGLAAALLRAPTLLVLDEPTSGLDPGAARDLHTLVTDLAAGGAAVLLSSHDMDEVDTLCDRVTVLARGRVVLDDTLAAARAAAPAARHRVHTSDDERALALSGSLAVQLDPTGLLVAAAQPELDAWVLTLGRAGVAVRTLVTEQSPLTALYFRLTEPAAG